MFCKHCGKEVADGAKFCAACGQPTGEAPRAAASSATGLPPILDSFLSQLMGLKNPIEAMGLAAKEVNFTGIVAMGLYFLVYVFYTTFSFCRGQYGGIIGFFGMFGISCAIGSIYLLLMLCAFCGMNFFAQGKVPNIATCINTFGLALIPSAAGMILNFGCSYIWDPLTSFISSIGSASLVLLLYVAIGKMEEKPVRNYFWLFCVVFAFASTLSTIINNEIVTAYVRACMGF